MSNNKKLTLTEALCIIQSGWGISDAEKRLYFEASELISNEVQRVRLEYQKQIIEEKLQDLKATNNKQSSVEWLLDRIEDVDSAKIWDDIKQQAKAMHKEEHEKTYNQGLMSNFQTFEQYYNETFNNQ